VDIYPHPIFPAKVTMRYDQLNKLVGTQIDQTEVLQIVEAMGMRVIAETDHAVSVEVPTNKVDVTREADLIEEVLRIYGFNRVPVRDRMSFRVSQTIGHDETSLRNRAANYLAAIGFNEIMGLSMVDAKYAESKVFHVSDKELVRINNTSNVQMEVMRPNLWITALETVRHNQYRQQTLLRLFEFGKKYRKVGDEYLENEVLAITISGWQRESWLESSLNQEYYALKAVVENILAIFGITTYEQTATDILHLEYGLSYGVKDKTLVNFGKISDLLCGEMDIRNQVFYAEFDWVNLMARQQVDQVAVQESSKFPAVRRDLALIVDKSVTFRQLKELTQAYLGTVVREINLFDVYLNDKVLGEGRKSYAISILLSDKTKTFSDKEIDNLMGGLVELLEKEVGARLR
jgi:phenylalanyl-tRNA synthetase beta chain